ncbi:MAG: type II toxin-antitoxin system HicB family antitoxin, partial [Vulcanimicrobiaceae bacterium]
RGRPSGNGGSDSRKGGPEKTMTYTVIFERASDGRIWARVPEIGGIAGAGQTEDQALLDLRHGIELWLELERPRGGTLPPPTTVGSTTITIDAA